MATRRRAPTRDELLALLAEKGIDSAAATAVLDALAALGCEVEQHLRIMADEEMPG